MKGEQQLIDAYLDGEISGDDETRLAEWLQADREHMRVFAREAHLHRQLREIMVARPFHAKAFAPVRKHRRSTWLSFMDFRGFAFRRALLPLTVCVALAVGISLWLFGPTMGEPTLVEIRGQGLSALRAGEPIAVAPGMRLEPGDVLRTPADVTVVIGYAPEPTRITVQPGTDLTLAKNSHSKHFELRAGKLEASVARQRPFHPMLLTTPQAEARVVGTRFTLDVNTNYTRLDVAEGKVQFTRLADGTAVRVTAGHYALAGPDAELSALPFPGEITRQWWTNINAHTLSDALIDPRYPNQFDASDTTNMLELPSLETNHLLMRYCGYLQPVVTGSYEFWLSGSANARMYLSADENPANKVTMANTAGTGRRAFDTPRFRGGSQWAPPVPLVAGHRYYIEVVFLIGTGEGHFSVAWKRSGAERELIPADCFSPFKAE